MHRATKDAPSWMERYFQTVGHHMPHNDCIHLPRWDSQNFVFERYQEDIISHGGEESDVVALRTFYRIWRDFSCDHSRGVVQIKFKSTLYIVIMDHLVCPAGKAAFTLPLHSQ